jgi:predicted nucleic acid-binding protein
MKVLIDTSSWVDFFNGYPSPDRKAVAQLIAGEDEICTCGVVVAEVFQGLRRDKNREELSALFRKLTYLEPWGIDSYFHAAKVYRSLRQRGKTVRSTIDCLIAVLAEENVCQVLAKDRDLAIILQSGLVKARLWPAESPSR